MTGGFDPVEGRAVGGYLGLALREVTGTPAAPPLPEGGAAVIGTVGHLDHLLDRTGNLPLGVLVALVDTAAGICGGLAALPDWVVSASLHLHRRHLPSPGPRTGPLTLMARTLRVGDRAVVTACDVLDPAGNACARGVLSSAVLTPAGGPPYRSRPVEVRFGPAPTGPDAHLERFVPITVDGPEARVELLDRLRNPWGILHGGVTGLLVDTAAAGAASGTGGTDPERAGTGTRRPSTVGTTVRFLAPARVGPVRATATILGRRAGQAVCRVEVHDDGAARRTALATAVVSVDA